MRRTALFFSVGAVVMLLASGAMAKMTKVDVCHVPPDNPANAHTINVSENAVPDHLSHGDSLDPCECQVNEDCIPDADPCTEDLCEAGKCVNPPNVCGPGEECNPDTGECVLPPPEDCFPDGDCCFDEVCIAQGQCLNPFGEIFTEPCPF